jgi:hypothetical protein
MKQQLDEPPDASYSAAQRSKSAMFFILQPEIEGSPEASV